MMGKRRVPLLLLCAALCVDCITGCGGEYAGVAERDAVSGSAVSGEAVSGDAIKENVVSGSAVEKEAGQDMSRHRFCTDTNLYYVTEDDSKIMQASIDGTHRECISEWEENKHVQIVYVDHDWLYYHVSFTETDKELTYRAPIVKDTNGQDIVHFFEAKKLVIEESMTPLYADSDYYFYLCEGQHEEANKVIKYDLKKRKKVSEENGGYRVFVDVFRVNDHYIMVKGKELYTQEKDSAKWKKGREFSNYS